MLEQGDWPALSLSEWKDTRDTLHRYTQIVGKVRLALTPVESQWANVPLYLTSRGLTTSGIPQSDLILQIDFDFIRHSIEITTSAGGATSIPLVPARYVADVYADVMAALEALHVPVTIWPMAVEVANPTRLDEDREHGSYDAVYVQRFWQVLVRIGSAFIEHRARFRGRHTPVEIFWGSFDLAYGRFSGRPAEAPRNSGVIMRIGMDAQEIAAGFWPGDDRHPEPAIYCYAYPKPGGIEKLAIRPAAAAWNEGLGEFLLSYDDIRSAPSPRAEILTFLSSTYDACAQLAGWDRAALDINGDCIAADG